MKFAEDCGDPPACRALSATVARYLRQQQGGQQAARDADEITVRAERRLGELLKETVNHKGSKGVGRSVQPTLPDGVSKDQSHRWQQIASVPDKAFEAELARVRAQCKSVTTTALVKLAKAMERKERACSRS